MIAVGDDDARLSRFGEFKVEPEGRAFGDRHRLESELVGGRRENMHPLDAMARTVGVDDLDVSDDAPDRGRPNAT